MANNQHPCQHPRRAPKPLDSQRLQDLALSYVARYATSAAKLRRYLQRKLRERGWEGEEAPDIAALVERYVELGYVDDEAFAKARSGSLMRRGYGPRRVSQALGDAGIAQDLRENLRPGEGEQRRAALQMARKRRFGPYAVEEPDRDQREKHLAAMLRAGHSLDLARAVLELPGEEAALAWASEFDDEPGDL